MTVPYRGVWISFLDFSMVDFGGKAAFAQSVRTLFCRCHEQSINRAIVHLRPFCDALYPSSIYPWSHLVTGVQGQAPGFDPLAILLQEAADCDIQVEGWLNPYRITRDDLFDGPLSPSHPALLHPEWTVSWQGGCYLNPALPEVTQLIVAGVTELIEHYSLSAIQFDDYFYPTTHPDFDCEDYRKADTMLALADWRRENISGMVAAVYNAIKVTNPGISFGISPHGDDRLNLNQQYADTERWLTQAGYIDYLMPQIYYGNNVTRQQGRDFTFTSCLSDWLSRPRLEQVQLYFGVGAFLLSPGEETQLGDWLDYLAKRNVQGYAIFRAAYLPQSV